MLAITGYNVLAMIIGRTEGAIKKFAFFFWGENEKNLLG